MREECRPEKKITEYDRMSAPVPQIFKVFRTAVSLSARKCASITSKWGCKFRRRPASSRTRTRAVRSCISATRNAGLFVVSEGWKDLKLSDTEVDALLKSPHLEKLKRFRHGVYHYQPDYFDPALHGRSRGRQRFRRMGGVPDAGVRPLFRRMDKEPHCHLTGCRARSLWAGGSAADGGILGKTAGPDLLLKNYRIVARFSMSIAKSIRRPRSAMLHTLLASVSVTVAPP
jgi:hypothetical protein